MKKTGILASILISSALFFASCEKCTTCEYSISYEVLGLEDVVNASESYCGKGNDVDAFESDWEASFNNAVGQLEEDITILGGTITAQSSSCTRD